MILGRLAYLSMMGIRYIIASPPLLAGSVVLPGEVLTLYSSLARCSVAMYQSRKLHLACCFQRPQILSNGSGIVQIRVTLQNSAHHNTGVTTSSPERGLDSNCNQ